MHFIYRRRYHDITLQLNRWSHCRYLICLISLLLCFFLVPHFTFASTANRQLTDTPEWQGSIVQILSYSGETLFNQGSGVVVSPGTILTSAHLLKNADKIYVLDQSGHRWKTTSHSLNQSRDIAILRSAITNDPVKFAINPPSSGETFEIGGYWQLSTEKSDRSFFRLTKKPDFTAEIIPEMQQAKALMTESALEQNLLKLVTTVGRGSYGAPVINRCGEMVGLVRPSIDKSPKELWQPHLPIGATVNNTMVIEEFLLQNHIAVSKANHRCLPLAEEIAQTEKSNQAKLKKQKIKLKKEKEKTKKALTEARKAQEAAGNAKKAKADTEKQLSEVSEIATDAGQKIESISSEVQAKEKRNKILTATIAGCITLALIIILLLLIKRRKDLSKASDAIAAASAAFADLRFEGTDSSGAPLAFYVLGRDILQRERGLLIGRNPDSVQVVIADDTVSRQHARLQIESGHLYVQDLSSTAGTIVNGKKISENQFGLISEDIIEFGGVRLKLSIIKE